MVFCCRFLCFCVVLLFFDWIHWFCSKFNIVSCVLDLIHVFDRFDDGIHVFGKMAALLSVLSNIALVRDVRDCPGLFGIRPRWTHAYVLAMSKQFRWPFQACFRLCWANNSDFDHRRQECSERSGLFGIVRDWVVEGLRWWSLINHLGSPMTSQNESAVRDNKQSHDIHA